METIIRNMFGAPAVTAEAAPAAETAPATESHSADAMQLMHGMTKNVMQQQRILIQEERIDALERISAAGQRANPDLARAIDEEKTRRESSATKMRGAASRPARRSHSRAPLRGDEKKRVLVDVALISTSTCGSCKKRLEFGTPRVRREKLRGDRRRPWESFHVDCYFALEDCPITSVDDLEGIESLDEPTRARVAALIQEKNDGAPAAAPATADGGAADAAMVEEKIDRFRRLLAGARVAFDPSSPLSVLEAMWQYVDGAPPLKKPRFDENVDGAPPLKKPRFDAEAEARVEFEPRARVARDPPTGGAIAAGGWRKTGRVRPDVGAGSGDGQEHVGVGVPCRGVDRANWPVIDEDGDVFFTNNRLVSRDSARARWSTALELDLHDFLREAQGLRAVHQPSGLFVDLLCGRAVRGGTDGLARLEARAALAANKSASEAAAASGGASASGGAPPPSERATAEGSEDAPAAEGSEDATAAEGSEDATAAELQGWKTLLDEGLIDDIDYAAKAAEIRDRDGATDVASGDVEPMALASDADDAAATGDAAARESSLHALLGQEVRKKLHHVRVRLAGTFLALLAAFYADEAYRERFEALSRPVAGRARSVAADGCAPPRHVGLKARTSEGRFRARGRGLGTWVRRARCPGFTPRRGWAWAWTGAGPGGGGTGRGGAVVVAVVLRRHGLDGEAAHRVSHVHVVRRVLVGGGHVGDLRAEVREIGRGRARGGAGPGPAAAAAILGDEVEGQARAGPEAEEEERGDRGRDDARDDERGRRGRLDVVRLEGRDGRRADRVDGRAHLLLGGAPEGGLAAVGGEVGGGGEGEGGEGEGGLEALHRGLRGARGGRGRARACPGPRRRDVRRGARAGAGGVKAR
ncbi:hypothetical protein JL720_15100 [Aureococcus anophagefferens]|nr:hypothetical protein JL720_15100 [Aureococcus anophagefferens]